MQAGWGNVKGHWENVDLHELNEQMLQTLGQKWFTLEQVTASDVHLLYRAGFGNRARELLQSYRDGNGSFTLKDPRMAKLLPFWEEIFREYAAPVRFLVAYRSAAAVARSLQLRDRLPKDVRVHRNEADVIAGRYTGSLIYGQLLWASYNLTILRFLQSRQFPYHTVPYSRLVDEPSAQLGEIADRFGASIDDDEMSIFCADYVEAGLRNFSEHEHGNRDLDLHLMDEIGSAFLSMRESPHNRPEELLRRWQDRLDDLIAVHRAVSSPPDSPTPRGKLLRRRRWRST